MDPNTSIARDDGSKSKGDRRSLIRKRPVSFGRSRNYHGNVYTIPSDNDNDNDGDSDSYNDDDDETIVDEDSTLRLSSAVNRRTVAMIGVPPEHVPEGILNLMRSHRPFVEHVRVVIADSDDENEIENENEIEIENENGGNGTEASGNNGCDEKEEIDMNPNSFSFDTTSTNQKQRSDRTYLILVQLFREKDATTFVEDLDGKPYIAFDDRDTCHIERVSRVETNETMPWKDGPASLLLGQPREGSQQSDGKSSKNHHCHHPSLPLLHPNFGTTIFDTTTEVESRQEKGKGKQKSKSSSRRVNISASREDSTINCAVCLEDLGLEEKKLDDRNALLSATEDVAPMVCTPIGTTSVPSLLTTVCNHTFHLHCLQQYTGPCPVCRYDHSGLNETLSQCHVCGTTEHNYVCLICGVVSCGVPHTTEVLPPVASAAAASSSTTSSTTAPSRFYTSSHAGQHYRDTLHAYALDTETQHVYDFCGQGYVHRLVQNKEDGKLVEVNDPRQTSMVARGRTPGERNYMPGLSDAQEGEVVHRKLEGAAEQYNNLLRSQLEQQRAFYEDRLKNLNRDFSAENQKAKAEDLLAVLRQERKQVTQRYSSLQRRNAKVAENVAFLTNMNESIEQNQVEIKYKIQQVARDKNDSKDRMRKHLCELEAKLSELTKIFIESMED